MSSNKGAYCIKKIGVLSEEGRWLQWLISIQLFKVVVLTVTMIGTCFPMIRSVVDKVGNGRVGTKTVTAATDTVDAVFGPAHGDGPASACRTR